VRGKREADRECAALVARADTGQVSMSTDTVGGFLGRWLETASAGWKSTTERRNRDIVDRVIVPVLGSKKLAHLGAGDLDRLYAGLRRSNKSEATIRRVHAVVACALGVAVSWGDLAVNPTARLTQKPVAARRDPRPPTDDEVSVILAMTETATSPDGQRVLWGPMWADLFTLAASTGLRRGELAALRWQDVDKKARLLRVVHSIESTVKGTEDKPGTGSTWAVTDTKTHQARQVPLATAATEALDRRWRTASSQEPGAFIFSDDPSGATPIHPDRISKVFTAARRAAGVADHVTLKGLRSYAATVIGSAVGLTEAQAWLGHKDVTTTARHYAARRTGDADRARDAIDAARAPKALPA
jgi:integrase